MSESNPPEPESPKPEENAGGANAPKPRSRRSLWVLLSVALVAIAGIAVAWRADRVSRDPKFCNSCHVAAVQQMAASAHKNQACADCHQSRPEENLKQWFYGLISSTKTTPHGKTDLTSCKRCHAAGGAEPWQMSRTLGHSKHVLKAENPLDCPKCHTWKDHQIEPDPDSCAKCHDDVKIYGPHAMEGKPQKIRCLSCHNYLARVGGGAQTPSHDCRRCHGGEKTLERSPRFADTIPAKAIPPSQIHGNLKACSLCHNPHQKDPQKRTAGQECSRCHAKIHNEMHASKQPDKFNCDTCHEAHGSRAELYTSCSKCHQNKIDAKTTVSAKHERCSQCHKPHEFKATYDGCRDCHKDQTTMLASWQAKTHAECTNCHKPHSTKEEDTTCVHCHKNAGGHLHKKGCTNCHDPHKSKTEVKPCADCHEKQNTLLARSVAPHRQAKCLTCHAPHQMANTPKVCQKCHGKEAQAVATARIDKHQRCASCHQTHLFAAQVDACRTCHQNPTTGHHTGKCTQCHQVHGPPLGQAASCRNCHKDIPQPAGKHTKCETCHKQSHGDVKKPVCGDCHQPKATAVAAWPANTHTGCPQCHQPHNPTNPKTCGQCHAAQDMDVKGSKHRCASCHEPHTAPQKLWSTCNKCHSTEVGAVSNRGTTHSACKSCHKEHKFPKPACTSCHKSLALTHNVKQHGKCTDCHDAHAKKSPSRADCLKCHADRTNHFPNAQSCQGCHPFTKVSGK